MDFLEKLDYLMKQNNLNKSRLSKACDIPYTTIDGWYKKGYEGLKLSTLRKLARYFGTTLDFWAGEEPPETAALPPVKRKLLSRVEQLNEEQARAALAFLRYLTEENGPSK